MGDSHPRIGLAASAILIGLLTGVPGVSGGDLDPPGGATAPTMKDLDDVSPRRILRNDFVTLTPIVISEPGSYYLGEDILGLVGEHGIEIDSSDVTLDLNGFAVRGNTEVGSLDGIHVTPDTGGNDRGNITIRNGTVRDFGGTGIDASDSRNGLIIDVRAYRNGLGASGGAGIFAGAAYTVRSCVSSENRSAGQPFMGDGIRAGHGSTIINCAAIENDGTGINAGVANAVTGCAARENGEHGYSAGVTSVFADCSASENVEVGIRATQFSVIRGCATWSNGGHGIEAVNECTITNSVASANGGDGINASNSLVRGNVASGNTGPNINALGGTTVIENHQ